MKDRTNLTRTRERRWRRDCIQDERIERIEYAEIGIYCEERRKERKRERQNPAGVSSRVWREDRLRGRMIAKHFQFYYQAASFPEK